MQKLNFLCACDYFQYCVVDYAILTFRKLNLNEIKKKAGEKKKTTEWKISKAGRTIRKFGTVWWESQQQQKSSKNNEHRWIENEF